MCPACTTRLQVPSETLDLGSGAGHTNIQDLIRIEVLIPEPYTAQKSPSFSVSLQDKDWIRGSTQPVKSVLDEVGPSFVFHELSSVPQRCKALVAKTCLTWRV